MFLLSWLQSLSTITRPNWSPQERCSRLTKGGEPFLPMTAVSSCVSRMSQLSGTFNHWKYQAESWHQGEGTAAQSSGCSGAAGSAKQSLEFCSFGQFAFKELRSSPFLSGHQNHFSWKAHAVFSKEWPHGFFHLR